MEMLTVIERGSKPGQPGGFALRRLGAMLLLMLLASLSSSCLEADDGAEGDPSGARNVKVKHESPASAVPAPGSTGAVALKLFGADPTVPPDTNSTSTAEPEASGASNASQVMTPGPDAGEAPDPSAPVAGQPPIASEAAGTGATAVLDQAALDQALHDQAVYAVQDEERGEAIARLAERPIGEALQALTAATFDAAPANRLLALDALGRAAADSSEKDMIVGALGSASADRNDTVAARARRYLELIAEPPTDSTLMRPLLNAVAEGRQ